MHTDTQAGMPSAPLADPLNMHQLTQVLVRHYGLTQGLFDLVVEFQIGTGAVGPDKDRLLPGAMIGLARVGLAPAKVRGPSTVDAAEVKTESVKPKASRKKAKQP